MCEYEVRQKILKMFEPQGKKRRDVVQGWLKEVTRDLPYVIESDDDVVMIDETNKLYFRVRNYEESNRVESVGFYKGRNWGEATKWGTPVDDLMAREFWRVLKCIMNWYEQQQCAMA